MSLNYFVEGGASRRSEGRVMFFSVAVHKPDRDSVSDGGRYQGNSAECGSSNGERDEDKVGEVTVVDDHGSVLPH